MSDTRHPDIPLAAKLAAIAWMAGVTIIFVAVSMSPDGAIAAAAPRSLLQLRELLLPFFQAATLY